jgi:hypothetical protein
VVAIAVGEQNLVGLTLSRYVAVAISPPPPAPAPCMCTSPCFSNLLVWQASRGESLLGFRKLTNNGATFTGWPAFYEHLVMVLQRFQKIAWE